MKKIIYKIDEKEIELKLDTERNKIWATQAEIAKLFNVGRSWITRQIKEENASTCSYYEQVAPNGKAYKMKHYSLEVILEIGYKIDVNKTLEFKEWVNNLIKEYEKIENVKSPMTVEIFENGNVKLEVYINPYENTIWLSQEQVAKLYLTTKQLISFHVNNILNDAELERATVKKNLTVQIENNREVRREILYYNLDMIISIGYRINSKIGISFRRWSNKILKQYLTKGFAVDETRVTMHKENYLELNNTVLRLENKVNNVEIMSKENRKDIEILKENKKQEINNMIFFKGELYDAYSFIVKLIKKAKYKLTLIDNYVDNITLDILSNKNTNVNLTIVTSSIISNISITNFNKQYPNLTVKYNNTFHDKFLVIDDTYLYLIGSSIKDAGKKCFAICEMNKDILNKLKIVI